MDNFKTNDRLELAFNYLLYTGKNVFLTGKAGTGKTTFLKRFRELSPKRMVVTSPTGVAAINAGGVTLHSFFQLSFGPQMGGQSKMYSFSKVKLDIIKSLDLLVIDEISMVRADLLDAVDGVLRRIRHDGRPFGGVQLLLIGDLQQLAPVVTPEEEVILSQQYDSFYFFGSKAWKQTEFVGIELNEIFRQTDNSYIEILNSIRDGKATEETVNKLNSRYLPNFKPADDDDIITLVTHNYLADRINETHMLQLDTEKRIFKAEIEGDFPDAICPADKNLILKVGAVVMFIKNDSSYEKRYFNGKIGRITSFGDDCVNVSCKDGSLVSVSTEKWENTKYTLDPLNQDIKETVIGTFSQIPLRTAWAVTIHKSQGLTFERMMLDASRSFSHGQVYVALSRCKTLEGLVLLKPFSASEIICDPTIRSFTQTVEQNIPTENQFLNDKKVYFFDTIKELFDFKTLYFDVQKLQRKWQEAGNSPVGNIEVFNNIDSLILSELVALADKFQKNIVSNYGNLDAPDQNEELNKRITNGCNYFVEKIDQFLKSPINNFTFECDDKEKAKSLRQIRDTLVTDFKVKYGCLVTMKSVFSIQSYLATKAKLLLNDSSVKTKTPRIQEFSESKNVDTMPDIYFKLISWRKNIAKEFSLDEKDVLKIGVINEIVNNLPSTFEQLKSIKGISKTKAVKFGKDILELVYNYKKSKGLPIEEIDFKSIEFEALSTAEKTLSLFNSGNDIDTISKIRNLKQSTIYGHLGKCVSERKLDLERIMPKEKYDTIFSIISKNSSMGIKDIYLKYGDKFSYDELIFVSNIINKK